MSGRLSQYKRILGMLADADAELKIVIAGNHDVTLDEQYYERNWELRHGGSTGEKEDVKKCIQAWKGEEARKKGIVYLEEGIRSFRLRNGAKFTVSPIRSIQPQNFGTDFL
jgi:hypothetical protein